MSLDSETIRWVVGGFISGLSVIAVVAYNDPEFYINWLVDKIMGAIVILYFSASFFWLGMKAVKDFALDKLSLTAEQSKLLSTNYSETTEYTFLIAILCAIAFFWILLMVSLAGARIRNRMSVKN
ncbi:hypothetical protein [Pantoea dispersa]|uniref:hypothetical protein n=1 Tax=Pantoea dispersa TaxID=59814 RepID=UPI0028567446|nr:hypothetical protein [Pantoea dispersa]MDR6297048.1 hypothetical protein [Pantoea dispersa]